MSIDRAKALRKNMTEAEYRLWYYLRAHRLRGHKFKRQAPIGIYIADFVSFERKIVIEVDGGQHAESAHDVRRDEWLRSQGFRVLRFWNNDVLRRTDLVLSEIDRALNDTEVKAPSPASPALRARSAPSPTRGEGNTASS